MTARPRLRLFHGGVAGLQRGDMILPAVAVNKVHEPGPHQQHYDPHRVYVTELRWYAQLFAHGQHGDVYRVRPVGVRLPDRDCRQSWVCQGAVVLDVVARHPVEAPERLKRLGLVLR
ncbi:hypothetical protein [Streptomyces sp. cg35]|uniref:hypothetical protein n=1 Tax=Streptomyces sp. cg35 TaxID=3421650 RepID=UPI003D1705D1